MNRNGLLKPGDNLVQIVRSFSVFSVLSVVNLEEFLNFQSLAQIFYDADVG
jgi:hypothetical protein